MIRNPSFHRGSHAQRFMDSAKVVIGEPQHNSRAVVLPLFAERVGEARKAAQAHSERQVGALDNRSADAFRIRITGDWDHLHGSDLRWRVSRFAFLGATINLDELSKACNAVAEGG